VLEEGRDGAGRIAQMRQQKSRIDNIESVVKGRLADIQFPKAHVTQTTFGCFAARQLQLGGVDVDTDRPTARTYPARKLQRGVRAATAHIEARQALTQTKTVKERR
jgi:hypothetical protein